MRERLLFCVLLFLLLFSLESAFGTSRPGAARSLSEGDSARRPAQAYQLRTTRVEQALTIDGRLTERAWTTADTATGFTQFKPNPGTEASRPTCTRRNLRSGNGTVGVNLTYGLGLQPCVAG